MLRSLGSLARRMLREEQPVGRATMCRVLYRRHQAAHMLELGKMEKGAREYTVMTKSKR